MILRRHVSFSSIFMSAALLLSAPAIQAQNPLPVFATGFCSTGLTPKAPQPQGCLNSKLVSPINPQGGGPIVDGNWDLAEPYPSAPATQPAPNPCTFSGSFKPAPVSAPYGGWYNPNDQLSQWIEPNGTTPGGWYIYRTAFTIPTAYPGYSHYELVINGKLLADDFVSGVFLEGEAGNSNSCRQVASYSSRSQLSSWNKLKITIPVAPESKGYLYFVVNNVNNGPNPTGLRVEFTSPYLYPF